MKKLDLAALGVEEMSEVQMQEVDGGYNYYYYNNGSVGTVYTSNGSERYILSYWFYA